MCFRQIDRDLMVKGTLLAMVEREFPEGVPSLRDFARESGVAPTTFTRAAEAVDSRVRQLIEARRPGPKPEEKTAAEAKDRSERERARGELEDLRAWLRDKQRVTAENTCFEPEAKKRIATLSEELSGRGVLKLKEIAEILGIGERQLRRIRNEVEKAGGEAPEENSRRPHKTAELHPKIQELITSIVHSKRPRADLGGIAGRDARSKRKAGYRPTDVKRILEKNYADVLKKYHDAETIALSTVSKYMDKKPPKPSKREHPRGSFTYPEPFQQVAIDTSYFTLGDLTLYFITVFEVGGRLNLLTRVFLKEDSEVVVRVVEEYLERFPGIEVFVIDRGTPYFNETVNELLESRGVLRLVCAPASPTMKAAAERHFGTLKATLRKSLKVVLQRHEHELAPEDAAFALELGAQCFAELYHQIPQEGIDGKSPAERIESFDLERAARQANELFGRVLDLELAEEVARWIHALFQLTNDEEKTVRELRHFGARVLRQLVKSVTDFMGPPHPEWMYDPLGYLAARARGIWERNRRLTLERKWHEASEKRKREEERQRAAEQEDRARERRENPERFVDQTVELLTRCVKTHFAGGVRIVKRQLEDLFSNLAGALDAAFDHELRRIKSNVDSVVDDSDTRVAVHALLDEIAARALAST